MEALLSILLDAFFIALLIWCSIADLKKRLVPNQAIIMLLFLGIAHVGLMIFMHSAWWIYPAGLVFAVPFFTEWLRGNIGAGDVKLVMAIALYLGLLNAVIAFALIVPILVALMIYSLIKKKTVKCLIPFAPVLSIGAGGAVLLGYFYMFFAM